MRKFGFAVIALALSSAATAGPIIGLYNTGVNSGGANWGAGSGVTSGNPLDPHWTMSSAGTAPATAFNGGTNGLFPLAGSWLADGGSSRWVTPTANAGDSFDPSANGFYTFSLNFVTSASARFTGRFAVDNQVTAIKLNGVTFSPGGGGFNAWTNFAKSGGFANGNNVLSFDVLNGAQNGGNPLGFRAEFLTSAVPEPATWAMMIGGFGIAGIALRRRRTLVARTA